MAKKESLESAAAREWVQLKAENKRIESRLSELKSILEPFLRASEDQTAELHGWRFKLSEYEQASFSLKAAQEKLDGRILAPFVTKSQVVQIRTSWQGGDVAAAA